MIHEKFTKNENEKYVIQFATMLYESFPAETRLTVYRRAPAQKLRDGSTSNLGPNKCLVRVTPTLPLFNNSRIQISPQLTQQRSWAICAACERAFSFVYACAHLFFGRECLSQHRNDRTKHIRTCFLFHSCTTC